MKMTVRCRLWLLLGSCVAGQVLAATPGKQPDYRQPTLADYQQLEMDWYRVFQGSSAQRPVRGFRAVAEKNPLWQHWRSDRGWGEVWYAAALDSSLFVQIPHRYYDSDTLKIGRHWMLSGAVKMLMANNVHRYAGRKNQPPIETDFSRASLNPMLAVSRALVAVDSAASVIQLHGFSADKRDTQAARQADMILSYGNAATPAGTEALFRIQACIAEKLDLQALVYPQQVAELGGTKNIVGRNLRALGLASRFLHIEVNRPARVLLAGSQQKAQQLLGCLINNEKK